jgi:hypothetical protein
MTRVLALALREMTERKLLFLGAALIGVITLLVPFTPIPNGYAYKDVVDVGAFVFALLLMVGGGVVLGATTIGRDLSSGRIAFFFTRELHAWEIWAGRIVGMFASVVLAAAVVLLPATFIGGGLRHLWDSRGDAEFPAALILALFLPLAAHYMSVALRSRSAWLALDVLALCVAAGTLWTLALPFLPYWFNGPKTIGAVLGLLTLMLAIAGWAGLATGRITPVTVHRWSALTLWSLIALGLLSFAAWSMWVFAANPKEIDWSRGWAHEVDGNGEWLAVGSGERKGRGGIPHEFLISSKTGAWMRLDDAQSVGVSADRRVAAIAKRSWAWRPSSWMETTIQLVDLTQPKPRARDTGIVLNSLIWTAPALSADGSRLAIIEPKRVSVYSMPDEKLLAAFPLEDNNWATLLFVDASTLQVNSQHDDESVITRFDIARRERISRHAFQGGRFRLDPTGSRVAIGSTTPRQDGRMSLYDTRSGVKLAEVPFASSVFGRRLFWLGDGEFALAVADDSPRAIAESAEKEPRVTIHSADGAERLRVPLPGAKRIAIIGEQNAGQLLVAWSDRDEYMQPCAGKTRLVAIDLATGAAVELPFKGWPKSYSWRMSPARGGPSTRLFTACDGTMVIYDAATGEAKTLLGGK